MKTQPKKANTPEGVLVRLKDKLCVAAGIDIYSLKSLIDKFVIKKYQGTENTKSHYDKINTYNQLSKNTMTIKVFFKFLKIITIKKISISVTITTSRGNEISVTEDVDLFSDIVQDDDE